MDGEVDRVLMKKKEGVDYEVSEMVEERWSFEKEVVVMTEEVEQVFIEHKEVVEVSETVEEKWSLEKEEEVVMTEEVEQVFIEHKQVVVVNKMMEERWSKGKEEVVMTEVAAVVEEEEVFEVNETVTGQFSIENEEVVMTREVEEVVEVNEMVVKRWSLEKEDVLKITKTIMDRWLQEKEEISEDQGTNFNGNTTIRESSCEAMVEYEKAVRKFLAHTTDCPKCVIKKDVPRRNTITILFVVGFIVQFAQLFISSVVNKGGLLRRAIKQSCESIVTIAYVFLYETQGLLISRTRSVLKRSYVMVTIIKQTLQTILIKQHHEGLDVDPVKITPSEDDGLPKPWSAMKQDGKDIKQGGDDVGSGKKDRKVTKNGKDHVVNENGVGKAVPKQLDGKVVNEKADSKAVGKQLNEEGDLVTKKTDEITVVKNEGLIRARITYMTTLVLYVHIRILSTVKQTYHHFFSTKNDKDLVTDQGGDNVVIGHGIVSGNGRVTQIKYIISQVLKVHMWFVVKNVYHKVFKWRSQIDQVITSQEDRRVTMWSFTKQTSYQLVVGAKLRLRSWTSIHVTTRLQTELLRIRSILKLDKVLNVKVIGQATKKILNWLRHLVIKEEILKSIVYGGLTEIIASISIVAFFADFDTTILNVIAFAIAGLIGGCFFFVTNIWELKKEASDKYREKLGRFQYFPFHAALAMLSFIIFGVIPPSTFVFSFLKTDDKQFAIWVVAGVSLICLSLLAIFKANVTSSIYRFKYLKSVLWYNLVAIGVSICSYLASKIVKGSIEDFGLFDTSTCDAMSRHN